MAIKPAIPFQRVEFDARAIDALARSQGVKMVHYKAITCPLGRINKISDHSPDGHVGCSNGFLYKKAGVITVLFHGNNVNKGTNNNIGDIDTSLSYITFPRFYDDCNCEKEVFVNDFDRLEMLDQDTLISQDELTASNPKGIDRLRFKIEKVEYLIDSQGIEYTQDVDFHLENGYIVWDGKRPEYNIQIDQPAIFSIRYLYRPYWLIKSLAKDIRISRFEDSDGTTLQKMPISVIVQREYSFANIYQDPSLEGNPRLVPEPQIGSFTDV